MLKRSEQLLKALGFIEAAKKKQAENPLQWAIERFRTFHGLGNCNSKQFMEHLEFVAKINQVGPYDPINNIRDD